MNTHDKPSLERDEARLVRSIKDGYTAPELTPARRRAIDAAVWQRVERRSRVRLVAGMAASAAVATGLFIVVRADHGGVDPSTGASKVAAAPALRSASDTAWADALLFDPAGESGSDDRLEELPDEYRAITDVLLEEG